MQVFDFLTKFYLLFETGCDYCGTENDVKEHMKECSQRFSNTEQVKVKDILKRKMIEELLKLGGNYFCNAYNDIDLLLHTVAKSILFWLV